MRIATWNVNSIRPRLPRLLALLDREQPDIVCLQETKVTDDAFPMMELSAAGYEAVVNGQKPFNGVAILSKEPAKEIARTFPGNPLPDDARLIAAKVGDVNVVSVYVINGRSVADPMYQNKLAFLTHLRAFLADTFDPSEQVVVAGDFNVCSDERDVWAPAAWEGQCHFTPAERDAVAALRDWGLVDLFRIHTTEGGIFSWWDYRAGAFHKRQGLRIDLILGTAPLAQRCSEVRIDREGRKPSTGEGAPSDHAPVIATFEEGS